jgi:hypothetical protein
MLSSGTLGLRKGFSEFSSAICQFIPCNVALIFSFLFKALGHCDPGEFTDDGTETTSVSTGSVQRTVAGIGRTEEEVGVGVGVGTKVSCI